MEFTKNTNALIGETIYEGVHKSGLKVYVMPKKGFSKSYAIFATNYGSINNRFVVPGETEVTHVPDGIAHFLEHKLFEEPDGGNVFEQFSKYGANANAFTSHVMTAYLFSCTEHFYENLEILLGYTQRPYFTDENVAKEQGIIGQEIRMYDDDPSWRVYGNALQAMYQTHPVNIDIAGTVESISKIDKEVLYRCYNTFYHPSNMALFTIGDVEPDKVGDYVERLIVKTEAQGEIEQVFEEEPKAVAKPLIEQTLSVSMPQFLIAFKEQDYEMDLLKREAVSSILMEIITGKSSPLYKKLYEEGLINSAYYNAYEGERSFGFSYVGGESQEPEKVREMLLCEIERYKREGIGEETFQRMKKVLYGYVLRLLDKEESFANQYVGYALKNVDMLTYPQVIESVTLSDVTERLRRHLLPEYCVMSVIRGE